MVIFMPYYRQHGQLYHARSGPSTSSSSIEPISGCKFASHIVCRFIFSLLLLIIAMFIFELALDSNTGQKEGTMIIGIILLVIALVSFVRTIQTLRRHDLIMHTRRRWIERLRERDEEQQTSELMMMTHPNVEPVTDLPAYKELFPSHGDLDQPAGNHSPPSYDDFLKTFVPHSAPSTTSSNPRLWITDRNRSSSLYIRGRVSYV